MYIEKLEQVTMIFSKYQSMLLLKNPIGRQTTVRIAQARQRRESIKVQTL